MKSIIRYLGISSIGAVIDFSIFFVFAKLLMYNYLWVAGFGFVIATLINYELCVRFIFERAVRFDKHQELVLIYIVSGIGLLLTQIILYLLISQANVELMISKITAMGVVFLWNYISRKYFIFNKPNPKTEA
jgi:putative flippase GtrA